MIDFAAHRVLVLADHPGRRHPVIDPLGYSLGANYAVANYVLWIYEGAWRIPLDIIIVKYRYALGDQNPFWIELHATFPSLTWVAHDRFMLTSATDCVLFRLLAA